MLLRNADEFAACLDTSAHACPHVGGLRLQADPGGGKCQQNA